MTEGVGFDARELSRAFARHDVDYVTVGGVAVQAYGARQCARDRDTTEFVTSSGIVLQRRPPPLVLLHAQ